MDLSWAVVRGRSDDDTATTPYSGTAAMGCRSAKKQRVLGCSATTSTSTRASGLSAM
jgi:hypothetical protein